MTFNEVHSLPEPTVVLCADNKVGLLIGWPREGHENEPCLIQVHGEEEARKVHHTKLNLVGRAVLEDGAKLTTYLKDYGK